MEQNKDTAQSASPAAMTDERILACFNERVCRYFETDEEIIEFARGLFAAQPATDAQPTFNHGDWIRNNYQDYPNIASLVVAMNQAERSAEPAPVDRQGLALSDAVIAQMLWDAAKAIQWHLEPNSPDAHEALMKSLYATHSALLSRASSSRAEVEIPDGWQLVPKEPTQTMIAAAFAYDTQGGGIQGGDFLDMYRDLLAAADAPNAEKGE